MVAANMALEVGPVYDEGTAAKHKWSSKQDRVI